MTAPLRIAFEVAAPQRHAFDTWTAKFHSWWPRSHTVSARPDAVIEFQPRVGGSIGEVLPDGTRYDWGTVTAWLPPHELGYRWHFGRPDADATEVNVRFIALDQRRTRVEIHHDGWASLGAEAEAWRERNVAGWDGLLPHFVEAAERAATQEETGS